MLRSCKSPFLLRFFFFGFAAGAALLVALVLSLLTGGALWVQLERLMQQVEQGNFKAVDFDNFDEFF